jgi:DNA-binding NarL/FixJ family response regulator
MVLALCPSLCGILTVMATGEARCLIVDDEPAVCRALERIVRRDVEPVVATSAVEASSLLEKPGPWRAFILDVMLRDGSGVDLLVAARRKHPLTPAMILTGVADPVVINAAHDLGATCVIKPVEPARIRHFLQARSPVEIVLGEWVAQYSLSDAEGDVLLRCVLGSSKAATAAARGSSALTVKKQLANALRKTRDGSLLSAVQRLLRETTEG